MLEAVPDLVPDLRELYEDLHAHPELSFEEHRTSAVLADRLRALGYDVTADVGRTGVVATLANGEGPTVLLRADIDALPVTEDTGLSYSSTVPGVAHACGHDMHAAWLVGAATILADHRDAWAGSLLLVVQPAEELGAGARAMLDDDLYARFGTPDICLGQHTAPAPAGWVLHRAGPMMAASDSVEIVLHGRGGHGSAPQNTVDPAVLASSTVMRLQTIVSREIDPAETAVVTVGRLHVGTKENIIADHAELGLSIRTFQPHVRAKVLAAITRIVEGECHAAGARQPEISEGPSLPVVDNDAGATERIAAAFGAHFGPERSMPGPTATGSEDFGYFGERAGVPSVFWFVGVTDPELFSNALDDGRFSLEDVPYNHSPHFAPTPDPSLATGVEALLTAAMCWLGSESG